MRMRNRAWRLVATAAATTLATMAQAVPPSITPLSAPPGLVSGERLLVRVDTSAAAEATLKVTLNGTDVSSSFRAEPSGRIGLVTGLKPGRNLLRAQIGGQSSSLAIIDHPLSGPLLPGTRQQPFICQTSSFKLPDGSFLGPALDADCSAATRISYVYMPLSGAGFRPLQGTAHPADMATTITTDGRTVPFIVRIETATINRGIHQSAILFDPAGGAVPDPVSPPAGWNRRLIAVHGFGCTGGWYIQGAAQGENILDPVRLGEGYALFTNTLRHPTNSCNAYVAGQTTVMDKQHFIETYGVPIFTVSKGSSGGAYTSLQVADAFPGLFDGVLIGSTFPDALAIALAGMDARLLAHYYAGSSSLTEAQKIAISGYKSLSAFIDAANQAQRTDPVANRTDDIPGYKGAVWNDAVPVALRYDPKGNPKGARPTIFDAAKDIYGVDPRTGFARRPFDNRGVQYGLSALNTGQITPDQFIDLNAAIGGYDDDLNFVPARSVGDLDAIRAMQQIGLALNGGGGLASIPVMDAAPGGFLYDEDHLYHYQWFHFAVRERMRAANGDAQNHIMWRGGGSIAENMGKASAESAALIATASRESWTAFIAWVAAVKNDRSTAPDRIKTIRDKPATLVDGCWTKSLPPRFIAEPQTRSAKPDSQCNTLYPSYASAREVAGGPLAANIYRCTLTPLRLRDYAVTFTAAQQQRLRRLFPDGVCDFSRPGVGYQVVQPQIQVSGG